jgi:hypothetical protein
MAAIQMRAMDHRVAEKLFDRQPWDVLVGGSMSVAGAVGAILSNLGSRKLSRLTLICHGYGALVEGNVAPGYSASVMPPGPPNFTPPAANYSKIYGGYGLEFGNDDLTLGTVAPFGRLKGAFTDGGLIVVFGCAAAERGPFLGEKLSGDGPALMKAMARLAGAPVRAADSLQVVSTNFYLGTADRGAWSGRTLLFQPDGRQVDESTLGMSVY